MKTKIAGLALSMMTLSVSSDTLYGVYVEAGASVSDVEGVMQYRDDNNRFAVDAGSEVNFLGEIKVEHFIPLFPNFRVATDSYGFDDAVSSGGFSYSGVNYGANFETQADVSETTGTLYYEILDNVVSLDVGMSLKNVKGDFIFGADDARTLAIDTWVPMAYGAIALVIPSTNLKLGGMVESIAIGDSDYTLVDAYLGYELIDNLAVDATIKVGYRTRNIVLEDVDNTTFDFDSSGVYSSVQFHF